MTSYSYPSYVLKALAEATVFQPRASRIAANSCFAGNESGPASYSQDAAATSADQKTQS